jgi:hypothetical protein
MCDSSCHDFIMKCSTVADDIRKIMLKEVACVVNNTKSSYSCKGGHCSSCERSNSCWSCEPGAARATTHYSCRGQQLLVSWVRSVAVTAGLVIREQQIMILWDESSCCCSCEQGTTPAVFVSREKQLLVSKTKSSSHFSWFCELKTADAVHINR